MANINAPFGLRPVRSLGAPNVSINEYAHDSGDSVALFIGDPVITTGTSTSSVANIPDGTPIVAASGSVTTGYIRGAVVGVTPTRSNLSLTYCPASVNLAVWVSDDPFQLYTIQSSGTAAVGDVSGNIAILTGTGSTYTGMSGYQANESSLGSTNVLRIVRVAPIVGNALGANGVFEVKINNHELTNTSGT